MQVTVLHLQDDLDAARMARFVKSRFDDPVVPITPKYGPVRIREIESDISKSSAVVLYVINPKLGIDRKTRKELQLAIKHNKLIYVVSSGAFKLPKDIEDYAYKEIYIADSESLVELLKKVKRSKKNKNFWKLIYHLLNLADLNRLVNA